MKKLFIIALSCLVGMPSFATPASENWFTHDGIHSFRYFMSGNHEHLLDITKKNLRYAYAPREVYLENGFYLGSTKRYLLAKITQKEYKDNFNSVLKQKMVSNYAIYCDLGAIQWLGGVTYNDKGDFINEGRGNRYATIPFENTSSENLLNQACSIARFDKSSKNAQLP